MVEVTVPNETRIEHQYQYKMAKDLAAQIEKSRYRASIIAVVVGAREFLEV